MTDADLQSIRERAEAATPGPWRFLEDTIPGCVSEGADGILDSFHDADLGIEAGGRVIAVGNLMGWDEFHFIAHARTDVPALLAEVERLRAAAFDVLACLRDGSQPLSPEQRVVAIATLRMALK